jgi:hypothetical protein
MDDQHFVLMLTLGGQAMIQPVKQASNGMELPLNQHICVSDFEKGLDDP